ncbi:MAG: serine hydrolase, partial [Planctomycetaceae bacterium]|nr:serine hydrolase [Planctomycetaceae bacterium]
RGIVHDPRAHALGGVAGHAGLFSTAADLAAFGDMILHNGRAGDRRILAQESVERVLTPQPVSAGTRSLGWDMQTSYSTNKGDLLSDQAIGHGGFTGTVLWIDPAQELVFVFLASRLHPDGKGSVNLLAGRIATIAAAALPE